MEYLLFYSLFITLNFAATFPTSESKQYRIDYEYNRRTNAFYKLHIEGARAWNTRRKCETEGAILMVPTSDQDIMQAHGMFKKYPDLGEYIWIGSDGRTHESAEEKAIIELNDLSRSEEHYDSVGQYDVLTRKGYVESYPSYHELPFMCKVEAKDAPYDSHCDVYSRDYTYYPTVGSCYKIPRVVYSWNEAYSECRAEGAHLIVLNSVAEHDIIYNLTNTVPWVHGAQTTWFFFAGFRADIPTGNTTIVFKTIFNQTLEEAGYSQWSPNEPNNAMNNEYCGTIFKNDGNFNDVDCSHKYAFICEKEVVKS